MREQELAGIQLLQQLEKLLKELDRQISPGEPFPESKLSEIAFLLRLTGSDPRIEIQKLARLESLLKPQMGHRALLNLLVPIERALDRNLRDDDFLIYDSDLSHPEARKSLPLRLVVDHWRSAFNVGSLFRSAEGLGVEKIHLTGYSPLPDQAKVARAALGSEKIVPWEHTENTLELIADLQKQGYRCIALETTSEAKPLSDPFPPGPAAFVLGNERFGLTSQVIKACDEVRILPLSGLKNSLNAAVIGAIAAHEWMRRHTPG